MERKGKAGTSRKGEFGRVPVSRGRVRQDRLGKSRNGEVRKGEESWFTNGE